MIIAVCYNKTPWHNERIKDRKRIYIILTTVWTHDWLTSDTGIKKINLIMSHPCTPGKFLHYTKLLNQRNGRFVEGQVSVSGMEQDFWEVLSVLDKEASHWPQSCWTWQGFDYPAEADPFATGCICVSQFLTASIFVSTFVPFWCRSSL